MCVSVLLMFNIKLFYGIKHISQIKRYAIKRQKNVCKYTSDMVLADTMRISESSQNSAARIWVNLILDQCLQKKAFETV